ncbi:MAG: 3'-5' exonuclease [Patescibacteria group bacterium]|nr:3'-5' exonuclease [Patescibacteria group bacterium]
MKLFFDTETTGKAIFGMRPDAPGQPRLVQLVAILTDDNGEEQNAVNFLIKPMGFTIPTEASAVHGYTTEIATEFGLAASVVVSMFVEMARVAKTIHAYNFDFDRLVMENEISRTQPMPNPFENKDCICEMKLMTRHCKIPGRYGDYKWPNLTEAHTHAYGKGFEGAHDAMADVRAMIAVHKWRIAQTKAN